MTTVASWLLALFAAVQVPNPVPAPAPGQSYPPAFPRQNATKLLETDRIVVWDIVWPKGQPSPLHRHVFDQVGTYYQAGGRAVTPLNGVAQQSTTPVGNISTTRKGTTHVEEGTTDPPLRAVFIEMKRDAASAPAAPRSSQPPRPGAKQVHAEDRVTVWDFTWSATGTPATARYDHDTVLVWLTPGTFRIRGEGGAAEVLSVQPGSFRYHARDTVETEELTAGSPRAMIFEFR
jgi:hypothetical protein